jgi:uncharacterized protein (DUF2267 family)
MVETGYSSFSTTVDKTNRFLREIEGANGWSKDNRNRSYAALRAVLHTLRDRLTVDEAAQLAAQLPLLVRGIFYDGWNPSSVPIKAGKEEFLKRIRCELPYDPDGDVEPLVRTVLDVVKRHIAPGEWEDIRCSMPKNLASMLP